MPILPSTVSLVLACSGLPESLLARYLEGKLVPESGESLSTFRVLKDRLEPMGVIAGFVFLLPVTKPATWSASCSKRLFLIPIFRFDLVYNLGFFVNPTDFGWSFPLMWLVFDNEFLYFIWLFSVIFKLICIFINYS